MKRNYIALWSLLGVAFLAMLLYSAFGDSLQASGLPLKPSRMADALLAKHAPDSIAADTLATDIPEQKPAEVDTVPKTILFIGDSMLEGLSPRLAAYCDASGHKLYTVIWYSSTSEIWGNAHLLSHYIGLVKPDYIFICLGANELFVKDIIEKRDAQVKSIIAEIGDIPFLWIGPPNWKPDTGINQLIARNVPKGEFFLSDGMEFKRKKDGAHPTPASAIEWMDSVARWMPLHSPHPILLREPEKSTSRPVKVYVHQPGPDPKLK